MVCAVDIYLDTLCLGIYTPLFTSPLGDCCVIYIQSNPKNMNLQGKMEKGSSYQELTTNDLKEGKMLNTVHFCSHNEHFNCNLIGCWSGRNFPIRNHKNISSLSGNLCYYINKNLSVKPLSSTWTISVFITICSLELDRFVANLAMITALKCWSLLQAFHCVVEKNKNVIHQPTSVRIEKTMPSVLSTQVS